MDIVQGVLLLVATVALGACCVLLEHRLKRIERAFTQALARGRAHDAHVKYLAEELLDATSADDRKLYTKYLQEALTEAATKYKVDAKDTERDND